MENTSLDYIIETKLKFDKTYRHLDKYSIVRPINGTLFSLYSKLCYPQNFTKEAENSLLAIKFAKTYNIYKNYEIWVFDKDDFNFTKGILVGTPLRKFIKQQNLDFNF